MTGYTKDELLEKTAFEMLVNKNIDKHEMLIEEILKKGFIVNHEEILYLKIKEYLQT